jgi:hypothetical protein
MVEAVTAMPWWALVALVLLSRGPTWLRDWAAAVETLRIRRRARPPRTRNEH